MSENRVRVRFAPAPTGLMHIGNIRTALLNYIFAKKNNGTLILRVEDTDPLRNYDKDATKIQSDLAWLGMEFNEGPAKGGNFGPYFQSQRDDIYKEYLDKLADLNVIYRCFCTPEELEKKRLRQIALKQPPRYDKICLKLTKEEIEQKLDNKTPFIWRFKVNPNQEIELIDLSKGKVKFNTTNLTDFPLTRQDGSFTFLFANAIDDILMKITHVFRGEDHLSNSANQLLIYKALNAPEPKFLHMPIICNASGAKLSKRDSGFSLNDLKEEGFLPEAINNYLAILGKSFEQEILSVDELAKLLEFNTPGASQIKYDMEKLRWINQKWISKLELEDLFNRCKDLIYQAYPNAKNINQEDLKEIVKMFQPELVTLKDIIEKTKFYFEEPNVNSSDLENIKNYKDKKSTINQIIEKNLNVISNPQEFMEKIKTDCKEASLPLSSMLPTLRLALTNTLHGPNLAEIIKLLGTQKSLDRLKKVLN